MKKATITNADLIYISGHMSVFKQSTLHGKIGYRFAKLLRKLTGLIEEWEDIGRRPVFEKYAVEMTEATANEINRTRRPNSQTVEAGTKYIPPSSAISKAYEEELAPILKEEIEIEFMNMSLPDFINALGRWPETFWYDALWFLWEDEEDMPDDFVPDFEKDKQNKE